MRAELEPLDSPTLLARLQVLDPSAAIAIDARNKRRLIRAIEVCILTGTPFSGHQILWRQTAPDQRPNGVFLTRPKADLRARIDHRVTAMFEHGVIEEVLAAQTMTLSPTAVRLIGLQDIEAYLVGRQTLLQCQERIRLATRKYSKRQITWFQRETNFEKVDLALWPDEEAQIALLSSRVLAFAQTV